MNIKRFLRFLLFFLLLYLINKTLSINNFEILNGLYLENMSFENLMIYLSINFIYIFLFQNIIMKEFILYDNIFKIRKKYKNWIKEVIMKSTILNISIVFSTYLITMPTLGLNIYIYIFLYRQTLFMLTILLYLKINRFYPLIIAFILINQYLTNQVYNLYLIIGCLLLFITILILRREYNDKN